MLSKKNLEYKVPFFVALIIIIGMIAGKKFDLKLLSNQEGNPDTKVEEVLDLIQNKYVDSPKKEKLSNAAILAILKELDPHSEYLEKTDLKDFSQSLDGNFEGIGIEFNIINDTVVVISAISGSPAQKAGINPGDKIIFINSDKVSGLKLSVEDVAGKIKGEKGTEVKFAIQHLGDNSYHEVNITRDIIPLYSIDASYLIRPNIIYLKINKFGASTHQELKDSLTKLLKKGNKSIILDLRGNPGGYLKSAVSIADEFLKDSQVIMYTLGVHSSREVYKATKNGLFERGRMVILIDEGTASAAEIVAGALQDHDRATIIGRRSFGKGLVQEPFPLSDGSAIKLTVARYYTPSGRCIPRPYNKGVDNYFQEAEKRILNHDDSDIFVTDKSIAYRTDNGKVVYGGGGILPDILITKDSLMKSQVIKRLFFKNIINEFASAYSIKNRIPILGKYPNGNLFTKDFVMDPSISASFLSFAKSKGVTITESNILNSSLNIVKSFIARNLYSEEYFIKEMNTFDPFVKSAIKELNKQ